MPEVTSTRVVVLVETSDVHIFQVDTTPFALNKYGSVESITYNKICDECVHTNDYINRYLYILEK